MKIQLLNSISPIIYEELPERYEVGEEVAGPDAILVRSADMHAMELPAGLAVPAPVPTTSRWKSARRRALWSSIRRALTPTPCASW